MNNKNHIKIRRESKDKKSNGTKRIATTMTYKDNGNEILKAP
jgi:hypothetical protein